MTKGHYTHHVDDSGKEPTIIEIKGEPYPEELGLDEFHRLTSRVAQALLEQDRAFEAYLGAVEKDKPRRRAEWSEALQKQRAALTEYEKMVSGE